MCPRQPLLTSRASGWRGARLDNPVCHQYPEAQAATPALEIHGAGSLGKRPSKRVERAQGLAELHQVPDLQASYLLSRLGREVRRVAQQTAALGDLPPPGNSEPRCCGTVAWGRHPPGGDKAVCCGAAPAMIERAPAREGASEPADRGVRGGDREGSEGVARSIGGGSAPPGRPGSSLAALPGSLKF